MVQKRRAILLQKAFLPGDEQVFSQVFRFLRVADKLRQLVHGKIKMFVFRPDPRQGKPVLKCSGNCIKARPLFKGVRRTEAQYEGERSAGLVEPFECGFIGGEAVRQEAAQLVGISGEGDGGERMIVGVSHGACRCNQAFCEQPLLLERFPCDRGCKILGE